jgi:RNA polymerase sigma factor (sigma-70 family)
VRTVDAVWKLESAKIVAGLTRIVHDVGLAEELAQDALVAALEQWPHSGVPDNPAAWLMTAAKRRAVDHLRRSERLARKQEQLARDIDQDTGPEPDDVLRLMFVSCHPILPTAARVALTLRLLGGLTVEEIARAFLDNPRRIASRIAEAKRTLAEAQVPFDLPAGGELAQRLSSVLEVVYLIFNEGYAATSGTDLMRPTLCLEALRLGRLLGELAPHEAEVHGLVALMEVQASRSAARIAPSGEPVPLHEQDRGRWDRLLIHRGFSAMLRAREAGGPPGPYVLQAAIAVCHAQAPSADDTDWVQIATLYDALATLLPTPIVLLNRAVAVGRARGPADGLALVDALVADPALRDYHLLPSVRGDLLVRLDRPAEARREFERAAELARTEAERAFLSRRAAALPVAATGVTLGRAADDFLCRDDLDAGTLRSYGQTLRRLRLALGDRVPLADLTAERVAAVCTTAWAGAADRTWNRHRAAVRSFAAWAGLTDLAAGLSRRTESRTRAPSVDAALVGTLCGRPDVALRERTLWLLLTESSAAVSAVLSLNVENLDLAARRTDTGVTWRAGTARLLPDLVGDRTRGPLFLADRRPAPARTPAAADLCPETGRRRLSYERAEYLFKQATQRLDPAGRGFTLRQLRPAGRGR